LYKSTVKKQQKLNVINVINYKHETQALHLTWQLADLNVLAHIYMFIIYNI